MPVIRQQRRVQNQPIGVSRINTGEAELWQTISRNANQMNKMAYGEAAKAAEKFGLEAGQTPTGEQLRTINPDTGKPEAYTPPSGLGSIGTEVYQRVIDKRFQLSMDQELKLRGAEIALANPNPEAYDNEMARYIATMSENSTGHYKTFIEETGAAYLASTKSNLRERAIAKARAAAQQASLDIVNAGGEALFQILGTNPSRADADLALALQIENIEDALELSAMTKTQAQAAIDSLRGQVASNDVSEFLADVSPQNRQSILAAIAGNNYQNLEGFERVASNITQGNMSSVLTNATNAASEYNRLYAVEVNKLAKEYYANFNLDVWLTQPSIAAAFNTALNEGSPTASLDAAMSATRKNLIATLSNIHKNVLDGTGGELANEATKTVVESLILQALRDGNSGDITVALNGNRDAWGRLTGNQQTIVMELRSHQLYASSMVDQDWISGFVNSNKDSVTENLQKQTEIYNLNGRVDELITQINLGNLESIESAHTLIADSLFLVGGDGTSELRGKVGRAMGVGMVNNSSEILGRTLSSADLSMVMETVNSNGTVIPEGMPDDLIEYAGKLISVSAGDNEAVIRELQQSRELRRSAETREKVAADIAARARLVSTGRGDNSSEKDRVVSDSIIANAFNDPDWINNSAALASIIGSPTVLNVIKGAIPQSALDLFSNIGKTGGNLTEAQFSFYMALANDTGDGHFAPMNHWLKDGGLSSETTQIMASIAAVWDTGTFESLRDVAVNVVNWTTNAKDSDIEARLGGTSIDEFIIDSVDDVFATDDLRAITKHLAASGLFTADDIATQLKEYYGRRYRVSDTVLGEMNTKGKNVTPYSLEVVLGGDNQQVKYFMDAVNAQLEEYGVRLQGTGGSVAEALAAAAYTTGGQSGGFALSGEIGSDDRAVLTKDTAMLVAMEGLGTEGVVYSVVELNGAGVPSPIMVNSYTPSGDPITFPARVSVSDIMSPYFDDLDAALDQQVSDLEANQPANPYGADEDAFWRDYFNGFRLNIPEGPMNIPLPDLGSVVAPSSVGGTRTNPSLNTSLRLETSRQTVADANSNFTDFGIKLISGVQQDRLFSSMPLSEQWEKSLSEMYQEFHSQNPNIPTLINPSLATPRQQVWTTNHLGGS